MANLHRGTVIKGIKAPTTIKRKAKPGTNVKLDKALFQDVPFETDTATLLDKDACPKLAHKLLYQLKSDLASLMSSEEDQDYFEETVESLTNKRVAEAVLMLRLIDKLKEVFKEGVKMNEEEGWSSISRSSFQKIPALSAFNKDKGWISALETLQSSCPSGTEPETRNAAKGSKNPEIIMREIVESIVKAEASTVFHSAVRNYGYLALTLTYCLKFGKTTFPSKYEDMVGEMEALTDLSSQPSELRGGLHAALLTPFTLLSPRGCNAFRNDNSAITVLQWLKAFGNRKPEELRRVEHCFYAHIMEVVSGHKTPSSSFVAFLVDVEAIDFSRCDDYGFFAIGMDEAQESDMDETFKNEEPRTGSKRKATVEVDEDEEPLEKKRMRGGGRKKTKTDIGDGGGGWKKLIRVKVKMGDIPQLSVLEEPTLARQALETFALKRVRDGEEYHFTPAFYPANPNSEFPFDAHAVLKSLLEGLVWLKDFSREELLKKFRTASGIVLTERTLENKDEFSESLLSQLGLLEEMRQVHDASLSSEREDGTTYIQASLQEMHASKDRGGHILNCIDIPAEAGGSWVPLKLASCRLSWTNIEDDEVQMDLPFPMRDMNWRLCGLSDALHDWHVDAEGLATWVTVLAGKKPWIVGVPGGSDCQEHAGIESFNTLQGKSEGWIKIRNLIGSGRYSSCFGIFHITASYRHVTNSDHSKVRYVLVNILNYWSRYMVNSPAYASHLRDQRFDPTLDIPVISTPEGLLDFVSLVNIIYLGTALSPVRYDVAALKGAEKAKMEKRLSQDLTPLYVTARLYADAALDWFRTKYSVVARETGEDCWEEVRYGYLVDQARTLVRHRHLFEDDEGKIDGVSPNLTASAIEEKIASDFGQYDGRLKALWDESIDAEAHEDYLYHRQDFMLIAIPDSN
ncbi:hypothetical protein PM082_023305 [Marasmius tenuissimus]|nr:hypothetical protein PM082_023305 [Marasmius tenuissimus]